jgi:hypothetical protein
MILTFKSLDFQDSVLPPTMSPIESGEVPNEKCLTFFTRKDFCKQTDLGLKQQDFPGSPTCLPTLQILHITSLHSYVRAFLKTCLYASASVHHYTHKYTHTQTHTQICWFYFSGES